MLNHAKYFIIIIYANIVFIFKDVNHGKYFIVIIFIFLKDLVICTYKHIFFCIFFKTKDFFFYIYFS